MRALIILIVAVVIANVVVLMINISGVEATLLTNIVIEIFIVLSVFLSYYITIRKKRKERRRTTEIKKRADQEIAALPKKYDYFCPKCLHQTNEKTRVCPSCRNGRLEPTGREIS